MADRTLLAWYAWRLAAMSPREIAHRVREQVKRSGLRRSAGQWGMFDVRPGSLFPLPPLMGALRRPMPDAWDADLRAAVHGILEGRFSALGREWPSVEGAMWRSDAWLRDPVTEKTWPGAPIYSFDIDYRHSSALGDVKYVWEVNRLQFLQPVAVLAARDGEAPL